MNQRETLSDITDALDGDGYDGQFRAEDKERVRCLSCRSALHASTLRADEVTRLEGESDPADMVIVIPLVCPVCGVAGTLIANYGPEASAAEAEVLRAFQRTPAEGDDLSEPTPGVTADQPE